MLVLQMPKDTLDLLVQDLSLKNVSSLPLNVNLSLKYPFAMVFGSNDGKVEAGEETKVTDVTITLAVNESYTLKVEFDPSFKDDCHIRTADEVLSISYQEHPHIVSIN